MQYLLRPIDILIGQMEMDVFVSWSGERSKRFASAIKEWLKDLLHGVTPWMSEHDIAAGSRWHLALIEAIERSTFGILCITSENQHAPWMIFEAGALSRQLKQSAVVPVLLDFRNGELKSPLNQFQSVDASRDGIFQLSQSLNAHLTTPLEPERLRRCFERCWPELETEIKKALSIPTQVTRQPARSDRDILEEMLELTRGISLAQIPVFTAGEGTDLCVFVDLRAICGPDGRIAKVMIDKETSVSDFLDQVYFAINRYGKIPAYTYSKLWLLKDSRTGTVYDEMGKFYCQSLGETRDERTLSDVGIFPDARLTAFRIEQNDLPSNGIPSKS